jgi:hypothetical protein
MATVFFSYSHHDKHMRDELEIHLAILKRQGVIETWHDRRIDAGSEFDHIIDSNLANSNIILLLVSPHFLASDYCYEKEIKKAMKMHNEGKARIIPIILEYCDWQNTPLKKLLAIPEDGKPISEYPNINKAFNEITQEIRKVAESFNGMKASNTSSISSEVKTLIPVQVGENIRSSNLRIKKKFSDYDKDKFMADAFEYLAKYFENSLRELEKRNTGIKYDYQRIDPNCFTVTVYSNGEEVNSCKIKFSGKKHLFNGITYSRGKLDDHSINESLNISDDGYILYLSSQLNFMGYQDNRKKLTFEGASEYYWSLFIEPLQK